MTPEQFAEQLRQAAPDGLRSVVLYGSAAAGDHLSKWSDYNILIVLDKLGVRELKALSEPSKKWMKAGNHTPVLFTIESLRASAHVYPIELLDMQDAHKILDGEDVLKGIVPNTANLRRQIEHDLRGKLLKLQSHFLLTDSTSKQIVELMMASLSKFLILCRATLRLYQVDVPSIKMEALEQLAKHIQFDREVFVVIHELKNARKKPSEVEAEALFGRYLLAIEAVLKAVTDFKKGTEQ